MATSTLALLRDAQQKGYAVPAFNIVDNLSLKAVVRAADRADSPVIIQASVKTAKAVGVGLLTSMFAAATAHSRVPVALHLDHCPDPSTIEEVVAAGWSSVLFDASHLDFNTAVRQTTAISELAHERGVEVESEIENIVGVEDGVGSEVIVHAYTPEDVVAGAVASNADLIAPQLGTAHGEYHGRPNLLPERVRAFRALTDKPIVLHGGTGLTEAEFRSFIEAGVSKINISTALKVSYMTSSLSFLKAAEAANHWDPPSLFRQLEESIGTTATEFFEIFGSAGRAHAEGSRR